MTKALALSLLLISATPLNAAEAEQVPDEQIPARQSFDGELRIRLASITIVSLVTCAAIIWLTRRNGRLRCPAPTSRHLRALDRIRVDSKSEIQFIQAGQTRIAVSLDAQGILAISLVAEPFSEHLKSAVQPAT